MTEPQNFENHGRYVPGYHFVLAAILLANLVIRIVETIRHPGWMNAWTIVMGVAFILMAWYLREFPKRAQDRVIRLEERMRLGRLLPAELRPRLGEFTAGQLIGLRFASDEELPSLAARVLQENIHDRTAIKRMIQQWRADHLRM
jgi:hypothetical protein